MLFVSAKGGPKSKKRKEFQGVDEALLIIFVINLLQHPTEIPITIEETIKNSHAIFPACCATNSYRNL